MVRTRFAPSPTGYVTIGNLRTALFEYLIAKSPIVNGGGIGTFVLRIEDTDQNRQIADAQDAIYKVLDICGLHPDEGPQSGGEYGPYIQSQRKDTYMPAAMRLVEQKKAYYCFCTKERLDGIADAHGHKMYDRHCLGIADADERLSRNEPFVIRQMIPPGETTFVDGVFGSITIKNEHMEDQVLIKSDLMPTYNFANVVDDHAMRITHVVRGSEYLTSTPKYVLLYEALGWDAPEFVHLPLILNADGGKISKRAGDLSILQMVEKGFLPAAIINYAALLGHGMGEREVFGLRELAEFFDIKNISKSPATFDIKKLTWMNAEHIRAMPPDEYYALALPYLQKAMPPGMNLEYIASITQSRSSFIADCVDLAGFLAHLPDYAIDLYTHKKMKTDPAVAKIALDAARTALAALADFCPQGVNDALEGAAAQAGIKKGQMLWSVRTALSGQASTPCGACEIAWLLGSKQTLARLESGLEKLAAI